MILKIIFRCDRDLLNAGVFSKAVMTGGLANIGNYSDCIKSGIQGAMNGFRTKRNLWAQPETSANRILGAINFEGIFLFIYTTNRHPK